MDEIVNLASNAPAIFTGLAMIFVGMISSMVNLFLAFGNRNIEIKKLSLEYHKDKLRYLEDTKKKFKSEEDAETITESSTVARLAHLAESNLKTSEQILEEIEHYLSANRKKSLHREHRAY